MIVQLIPDYEFLHTLAEIMEVVFGVVQPVLTPIGEFMVYWISFLLQFFPFGDLIFYYIIFVIIIAIGVIVNCKWPGDELSTKSERKKLEKSKAASQYSLDSTLGASASQTIETTKPPTTTKVEYQKKCKNCGMPLGDSSVCAYCGSKVDKNDE